MGNGEGSVWMDKQGREERVKVLKKRKNPRATEEEAQRLAQMWKFEQQARRQGAKWIAGLDEAGRGPWAGPVAAAAVVLPTDFYIEGIDDSKKLTAAKRAYLAPKIRQMALDWSVVFLSPQAIDRFNILEATRMAMTQAVLSLTLPPDYLLLDAITLPKLVAVRQEPIIQGDQKSISIACASILAKVTRDQAMEAYETLYPGYGFSQHKGYGTKRHRECLQQLGVSPIHRRTYRPVREVLRWQAGQDEKPYER